MEKAICDFTVGIGLTVGHREKFTHALDIQRNNPLQKFVIQIGGSAGNQQLELVKVLIDHIHQDRKSLI